ncbi:MAG: M28 family peptidase [Firmicutes bacterium]|nr:M28 family peptidase [Bacillota bacterium]
MGILDRLKTMGRKFPGTARLLFQRFLTKCAGWGQQVVIVVKGAWLFLVALVLLAVVTLSFLYNPGIEEYPDYEFAVPESSFDGEQAYALLDELVSEYPGRTLGSEANAEAALWLEAYFADLDLNVSVEEFEADYFLTRAGQKSPRGLYWQDLFAQRTGQNVLALSPGAVEDLVVIAAHRDIYDTWRGANANGSGTAVLMELARVLSTENHHYTYMFVSLDGGEAEHAGAFWLAEVLAEQDVALAITLDQVGLNLARSIGLYNVVTKDGQAPLWTLALARTLPDGNRDQHYAGSRTGYLWQKIAGVAGTDSHPFLVHGIPAVGLRASQSAAHWAVSELTDSLEIVSEESLAMAGRFTEQYVRALEVAPAETGSNYIPLADGYLPDSFYTWHLSLFLICLAAVLAANLVQGRDISCLKREWRWLLPGVIAALIICSYGFAIERTPLAAEVFLPLLGMGLIFLVVGALTAMFSAAGVRSYQTGKAAQRTAVNSAFAVLLVSGLVIAGPLVTALVMGLPVALLSRPGASRWRRFGQKIIWTLSALIALVIIGAKAYTGYGDIFSAGNLALVFWTLLVIYVAGVYSFCRPRLEAVGEEPVAKAG